MTTSSDDGAAFLPRASSSTVVAAALTAFAEQGYHGTSVRDIARRSGVTVAAIYYHFPTKHDLLDYLMTRLMTEVVAELRDALDRTTGRPEEQLAEIVRVHLSFHTSRQNEAFIANTELRSLEPAARARVVRLRDSVEAVFREVIREGVRVGAFRSPVHPDELARAILGMSMHVGSWFGSGSLTAEDIADRYAEIALDVVRCDRSASTPASG